MEPIKVLTKEQTRRLVAMYPEILDEVRRWERERHYPSTRQFFLGMIAASGGEQKLAASFTEIVRRFGQELGMPQLAQFPAFRPVRPKGRPVAGSSGWFGEGGTCGFCAC